MGSETQDIKCEVRETRDERKKKYISEYNYDLSKT
jgi:hypothetical protein